MEHVHSFSLWNIVNRYNFVFQQKTVVLTKRSIPASVDLDDKKDVDGGEGSSLLYRQAAASETSASGNSQPKRSAVSEGFENPSTSASVLPYRALCEF